MMKGCINNHENQKAIWLYQQYNGKHDDISHLLFIKACINIGAHHKCQKWIDSNLNDINNRSIQFISTLIDFYGKTGDFNKALDIFNNIPSSKKDIVCFSAMMKCCIDNNEDEKAMLLYEQYNGEHDDVSNLLFIKSCINVGAHDKCKKWIDSNVNHLSNHSIQFISTLINFYGKTGDIYKALEIFNNTPHKKRNIVCIAAMMDCFIDNDENEKAMLLHEQYNGKHDDVSNCLFIKACINSGEHDKCKKWIDSNINDVNNHSIQFINTLIDFHGKGGDIDTALNIFNNIPNNKKDVVSINAMMKCFIDTHKDNKAILLHEQYNGEHNDISNLLFIKACTNIGAYDKGKKWIDSNINDVNSHSIRFINTLIDFYGNSSDIDKALNIFNNLPNNKKDIISIDAMMNAYINNDEYNKALHLFYDTKKNDNICFDECSYCIALDAAGYLVSPHQGSIIINHLQKKQNIFHSLDVQSAIIRMYAKCCKFEEAKQVFDNIDINKFIKTDKNGILRLYASMMDCYAKIGNIDELLSLFNALKQHKQIKITNIIYCIVLNACSHCGLIKEALRIFNEIKYKSIIDGNNIDPNIITAFVDCLGRKNYLDEAENIYLTFCHENNEMFYKFKMTVLLSLLSSCRIHKDIMRGQRIFNMMENIMNKYEIDVGDIDSSMYILLSNIYGQSKEFEKANKVRQQMKKRGIKKKKPGISWIEINGETHTFMANDKSHPMYNEILKEREIIKNELKHYGHIFDGNIITRKLNKYENIEDHLCGHSEKTALIYGLIMNSPTKPIVIAKNLRICQDCHNATKLISKIRKRKILIRDNNRWHIFQNGQCSCNDYF